MIQNEERILKVIELGNSKTEDQENMVEENIGELQLRNFIRERQIEKDVTEITIEVSAEGLLANETTFKNKFGCRALLETLCEIKEN